MARKLERLDGVRLQVDVEAELLVAPAAVVLAGNPLEIGDDIERRAQVVPLLVRQLSAHEGMRDRVKRRAF